MSELGQELDTYGGAVRHRQERGDDAADDMKREFVSRVMEVIGGDKTSDDCNIITRNSFFVVMKRKT